jgi:hypothetical protein
MNPTALRQDAPFIARNSLVNLLRLYPVPAAGTVCAPGSANSARIQEGDTMSKQESLWDYAAEADRAGKADRDRSRRRSISRLRASGHWLILLRVARTIPQPFTLNDISVAVWQARPDVFGMRGYPHPDNHKVHYILYGSRGLIAKGIIKRVQEGLFRLPDGLDVEALAAAGIAPAATCSQLEPEAVEQEEGDESARATGQAEPRLRSVACP